MPQDLPDRFSEKPFAELDAQTCDQPHRPEEFDFSPYSMERFTSNVHTLLWDGPTRVVKPTGTAYADHFGTRHALQVDIPPGTLFPLDDLSFPAGAQEFARARDAKVLVRKRIALAKDMDCCKDAAARRSLGHLFGTRATLDVPRQRCQPLRGSAPRR